MFWRSSTGVFFLMAMTTCFILIITGCILLVTVGGAFQKPPVIFSIHVGSGDVCSLCNNSLGCALTLHETFPDMKPEEVRQRCEITICDAWLPTNLCTQFWEGGAGRAVVRAAWYNESAYCAYSPSCNSSSQPTAPPSPAISGACCTAGVCNIVTSRNCTGGTYQGDYTLCSGDFCGSCCSATTCTDTTSPSSCGGVFQGYGTTCGGLCGGCSYNSTACSYTLPSTCSVGTFLGRGILCGSTPGTTAPATPNGGCCYTNAQNSSVCQVGTAATCTLLSGVYMGDYSDCSSTCGACLTPTRSYPLQIGDTSCAVTQQNKCPYSPQLFVQHTPCTYLSSQNLGVCVQLAQCGANPAPCFLTSKDPGVTCPTNMALEGISSTSAGCFDNRAGIDGDCWCAGNSTCQTVPVGYCMQSSCTFQGSENSAGTCPSHGSCTLAPTSISTTAPPPTTPAPPPPAPTGSTLGTCCVKGVATKNVTSSACTSAGTAAGTTGYWFPVVPGGTTTCSACCGNVPLTVFSCTAGLYYSGSTYTCNSANGYVRPTNPAATYCKDSSGGYKCNRCWEQPTTSIVASYIGSADPSFVWTPPTDCVGGTLYNQSGSIVTASATHVYTTGLEVVDATTSAPNTLGGGLASAAVWPRSYATGNSLIHYTSTAATPITMTWQAAGSSVWALAVYISFQAANTDPKALGTFQLTAVDGFGNVAYNSLKTSPLFGTPLGWVVWSNMINIAQLQIVDINAPQAFYLGDFNARSG